MLPTTTPLDRNLKSITDSIELCLGANQVLPALILLYSAIDAVAALELQTGEGTKSAFTRWVGRYMNLDDLGCTALELYAARCGLLHAFSGSSELSQAGRVRVVVYAWGSFPIEAVRINDGLIARGAPSVAVHVNALRRVFADGVSLWLRDIGKDPERVASVSSAAATWFVVTS